MEMTCTYLEKVSLFDRTVGVTFIFPSVLVFIDVRHILI